MSYVIDGMTIDCCKRCLQSRFFVGYPVIVCQNCKAIISASNGILTITFQVGDYRVRICNDRSYINDVEIKQILPFDITEYKLKTYLLFS